MSFFSLLLRDRRVGLLALLACSTLVLGLWTLTSAAAIPAAMWSGYWVLLVVFALFGRAAWRMARAAWQARRPGRIELGALALVLACGSVLLAHERYGFKILNDEVLLLGTSMTMHLDRAAAYPLRANDVQGPFVITQREMDKRPFFYPFLVALTHDLTGYRATNPFYVNTVLGFGFLALIWLLGRNVGGSPWAGAGVVLLFTGLPLFAQQMAGGGMDLLNLVMLAVVALLARRFAEQRDADSQEALVLAAVLLAFCRYESVGFLAPVAGLALWAWAKDGRVTLTWPVILAPLALLPVFWQHHIFALKGGTWELPPGLTTPFSFDYVANNLGHALNFFFCLDDWLPNSPAFAALGLLALPFFGLWSVRVLRTSRHAAPTEVALAGCGVGLFGLTGLLMFYYLSFDNPMVHRLSLPTYLLMALAIAAFGGQVLRQRRWGQALVGVALVSLVTQGLPVMTKRAYETSYTPGVKMAWREEFLRRYPERDYLFIDQDSFFWIANHVTATFVEQAKLRKDGLVYLLRNHTYSAIYVFQTMQVDPATGQQHLYASDPTKPSPDDLGPDFELETVWERRFETLTIGRISRVRAIRANGERTVDTGLVAPTPGPSLNGEALEKARVEYLKQMIQELP